MDSSPHSRPAEAFVTPTFPLAHGLPIWLYRTLLVAALMSGLTFRVQSLDAYGFSEDEAAKLRALAAYARGELAANAEHPMLMKLAVWASLEGADVWNRLPGVPSIAPEAALRLPNALAGTATIAAVAGVAGLFFGPAVAVAAAWIVALDPNVTSINRIGKEDTLAMLFLMLAVFCYERAKIVGARDPERAQPWYRASGASFGLMMASKYVPWFFGMYALYNVAAQRRAGANVPRKLPYYGSMAAAFLAMNFAILLPDTWAYCLAYVRGEFLTHHGYMYAGELYPNSSTIDVAGVPATFYLHLIAAKVPLPVLLCAVAGMVPLVRRRRERGFVWLRVFLVLPLLSYSLFASKFLRYALATLLVLDVLAAVGLVAVAGRLRQVAGPPVLKRALGAAPLASMAVLLLAAQLGIAPFYSTYQNAIGAARARPLAVFHEEAYDYGVREAIAAIAPVAAPAAAVVSDVPMAVEQYLGRFGRTDLQVRTLSGDGLAPRGEQWALVQERHTYFENVSILDQLRRGEPVWREFTLRGTPVLQVYRPAGPLHAAD